jgi:hypothetical protein
MERYTLAISPLLSNMEIYPSHKSFVIKYGEIYPSHKSFVIKYGGMAYRGGYG